MYVVIKYEFNTQKIPTTPLATPAESAYEYAEGAHHVVHLLEVAPDD